MISRPLPKSFAYQDQRKHPIIVSKNGQSYHAPPVFSVLTNGLNLLILT